MLICTSMRVVALAGVAGLLFGQDAREIVRKSLELDRANFRRARDYTWTAARVERQVEATGKVKSEKREAWETINLYGEAHRKFTERNSKPLSPDELRKQQERLDKQVARLRDESPQQKQRRVLEEEKKRQKEREFLLEMPEIFNFKLLREDRVEVRPVWVISATPKQGYKPKNSDGKNLQKVKGTLWIDKAEYQWVRVEAETIDTLTWGLFIGRVSPGAKLLFEQTRVNEEVWLPKRQLVSGSARILGKKFAGEEEVIWSNFRKFRVESNIIVE